MQCVVGGKCQLRLRDTHTHTRRPDCHRRHHTRRSEAPPYVINGIRDSVKNDARQNEQKSFQQDLFPPDNKKTLERLVERPPLRTEIYY